MIYPGPPPQRYRPCVGILLINNAGNLFVGERLDTPNGWQMPQVVLTLEKVPSRLQFVNCAKRLYLQN